MNKTRYHFHEVKIIIIRKIEHGHKMERIIRNLESILYPKSAV